LAQAALAEIKRIQTAHRLATISELVTHRFHLSPHHLRARARDQRTVFCRQVAMHLCRRITGTSFTLIGRYFGRDHSTCIYTCRLIERRRQRDAAFRRFVEQLADQITGARPATTERFDRRTARTEPKRTLMGTAIAVAELSNQQAPPPAQNSFAVIYRGVTV
jgi:Bacterial dnaA protein helix-turn-helix